MERDPMNLLLRPGVFQPVPYRPKFRLERLPADDDWSITDDEDIIAVIVAMAD